MRFSYAALCFVAFTAVSAPRAEADPPAFCAEAPAYCDAVKETVDSDVLAGERAAPMAPSAVARFDEAFTQPALPARAETETTDPAARTAGVQFLDAEDLRAVSTGVRRLDDPAFAGALAGPLTASVGPAGANFSLSAGASTSSGGTAVNLNVSVRVGEAGR